MIISRIFVLQIYCQMTKQQLLRQDKAKSYYKNLLTTLNATFEFVIRNQHLLKMKYVKPFHKSH